jgi:FkbM family methyltransferase
MSLSYYSKKLSIALRFGATIKESFNYFFLTQKQPYFRFRYRSQPFFIRNEDFVGLREILIEEEYAIIKKFPQHHYCVLDLGANVGLFSIYFRSVFPNAHIVSVEPSKNTFAILTKTIKEQASGKWSAVNKAIYDSETSLSFSTGGASTARKVIADNPTASSETVQTATINNLLKTFTTSSTYNVVKMDIEGAEERVVLLNNEWLTNTHFLIIELHDVDRSAIINTLDNHFPYKKELNRNASKPLYLFSKHLVI